MVVSCCAYGCTNRFVKGAPITFHKFPKDPMLRSSWEQKLRRVNFKATEGSRICSRHFKKDCFDNWKFGATWLKNDAVPTEFDFPDHLLQAKKSRKPLTVRKIDDSSSKSSSSVDDGVIEDESSSNSAASMNEPPKKKKRLSYLGDFTPEDMNDPTLAKRFFEIAQKNVTCHKNKMMYLGRKNQRLKKKVASKEVNLMGLKQRSLISDSASNVFKSDKGNNITSSEDFMEGSSSREEEQGEEIKEEADDQQSSEQTSEVKVEDDESVIGKEVKANFTEIEDDIFNMTAPVNEPVELKVCCVRGCRSQSDEGDSEISYHRFPPPGANTVYLLDTASVQRELDQREAWRQLLRLERSPTDDMVVCSKHFRYQDFIDPETDAPSERALHPQAVPIRCPPSYEGLRETILNEIRKERKLLAKAQPAVTDEEACALRVQQLASEWSDGEDSRPETQPDEGFTQEEWLNEEEWMSETELDDAKNADLKDEQLEEEYLSDMDGWDDLSNHQLDAMVNGDVTHRETKNEEKEKEELEGGDEEDVRLYDFGSSASMSSNEDILEKFSIDLRSEQPTTFLPLLGDAATRILSDELVNVKMLVKETRARVHDARALKNRQLDEIVHLRRKIRETELDRARSLGLEGSL